MSRMGKNLENQIREGLISSLFFEKTGKTLISSPPRGGAVGQNIYRCNYIKMLSFSSRIVARALEKIPLPRGKFLNSVHGVDVDVFYL